MNSLCFDPNNGVFRSMINGDDARHPSTPANVLFDGFAGKVHGATMYDLVPWSRFSAPTAYNPNNAQASSAVYYGYQVNFPQPLQYVPFFSHSVQGPDGVWGAEYSENHITFVNNGGVFLPQGTATQSGAFATNTYLLLYYQVVNFPNNKAFGVPKAFSYRLFGV